MTLDLDWLAAELRTFAEERNWNQFHTPKNLVMAMVGEVGELSAEFQWLSPQESEPEQLSDRSRQAIENEIADVMIYLVRLADRLDVDLKQAVEDKLESNRSRYTIANSYGSSAKIEDAPPQVDTQSRASTSV